MNQKVDTDTLLIFPSEADVLITDRLLGLNGALALKPSLFA